MHTYTHACTWQASTLLFCVSGNIHLPTYIHMCTYDYACICNTPCSTPGDIHTCMAMYVWRYTHMYTCTCITHPYKCACMLTHVRTYLLFAVFHVCVCKCRRCFMYVYAHVGGCMHTCVHTDLPFAVFRRTLARASVSVSVTWLEQSRCSCKYV